MKIKSSKKIWKAIRERYTWYLQPPFNDEFDRSHWWENKTQIDPVAALYELARRHPLVGEARSKFRHAKWYGQELRAPLVGAAEKRILNQAIKDLGKEPKAVECLCKIGLKSWPKLDWSSQEFWGMSAGKMKGLDCRDDLEQFHFISSAAIMDILRNRAISLKLGKGVYQFRVGAGRNSHSVNPVYPNAFAKGMIFLAKDVQQNPIPTAEMEAAIAREAVAAHREGRLLISVAPDLTIDEATILFEREYRKRLKFTPKVKQRARRPKDWLRLVEQFDNAAASSGGVNSRGFHPYRKAIDGICF
jgi:hypothetical protein